MDLRLKTARGVRISLATTIATTVAQAVIMAALGRLLRPAEYGLAAAALVVVKPVQQLLLLGMEQSAVLQTDLPPRAMPSLFWVSLCAETIGCVAIVAALLLLPGIPAGYRDITIALSFLLPASVIAIAPRAQMRRELAFGKISIAEFLSVVFGFGGVGIAAALAGCGAFSLAYGYLAQAVLRSAISCALCPGFPPRWDFAIAEIKPILSFGARITKVSVLENVHGQVLPAFVALYFGWAALGQFNQGLMLITLPMMLIAASMTKVIATNFRLARGDRAQLEDVCRTLVEDAGAITLPICFGMAAAAAPLVKIVLGSQWGEAAALMPWLCLGAACNCLAMLFAVMNEAVGRLEEKFVIQGVATAALVALLFIAGRSELERCAQVFSVSSMFYLALQVALSRRVLQVRVAAMAQWMLPGLQCSVLVAGFILGAQAVLPHISVAAQTGLDIAGAAAILWGFYALLYPRLLRHIFELVGVGKAVQA
jgi:O-antigen/teichoic acid export membrane protein